MLHSTKSTNVRENIFSLLTKCLRWSQALAPQYANVKGL